MERKATVTLYKFNIMLSFRPSSSKGLVFFWGFAIYDMYHSLCNKSYTFFLWYIAPNGVKVASLLRFLVHVQLHPHPHPPTHTHTHTHPHPPTHTHTVGLLWTSDQHVAEAATYTTHNKYKGQTFMPSVGFEPAIPAIKRLQRAQD